MRNILFSIMADRTKHIHVQRSFHFLAECHKMLAKRLIGEMTVTRLSYGMSICTDEKKTCGWQLTHNTLLHSPTGM